MNNAKGSEDIDVKPEISSDARLVILPKKEKINVKLLGEQEISRVGNGIYLILEGTTNIKEHLADISHFRFRRVREIPPIKSRDPEVRAKKVFAIVWYQFASPTAGQKKRVQRLIHRAPCIRLRPGVLLFPHLRSKDRERYLKKNKERSVLGSKEFSAVLEEMGGNVARWTRLQLVNQASNELLYASLEKMSKSEIGSLEAKLRTLKEAAVEGEGIRKKLKERYSEISSIYRNLRSKYEVVRVVWGVDLRRELKRTYNLMLRTKHVISS
ncbi:hypothetical protein EU537_12415 [Candidatus Thorarchaeota archaeon]|nr:MAG: hypothetical protein EU537_12415 [Candidatus Thorarchaeota archaeon]